jgi:hypothetical protein
VIRVTPSFGQVSLSAPGKWIAAGSNDGGYGEATMSRNGVNSGLSDDGVIDDRNERPLAIALATIATMWLLAFGLVFMSAQRNAQSQQTGEGAEPLVISIDK